MRTASRSRGDRSLCFLALCPAVLLHALVGQVSAQTPERINIYRYVLDIEVPESPALVALGVAPFHVLASTTPKPLSASLLGVTGASARLQPAFAFEVAPYFLFGGGVRTLESARRNSLGGRLSRVGTKTVVSFGARRLSDVADAMRVAVALRATLHDPHDPINNGTLVERVAAATGGPTPDIAAEDIAHTRVVDSLFADVSRAMRSRPRGTISAGWGVAGTLPGTTLDGDRVDDVRHTLWLSWQRTLGARFDFLLTTQALHAFDSDREYRFVGGLRRKAVAADFLSELYFDSSDDRMHAGFGVESLLARGMRLLLTLTTEPDVAAGEEARQLRVVTAFRWSVGR